MLIGFTDDTGIGFAARFGTIRFVIAIGRTLFVRGTWHTMVLIDTDLGTMRFVGRLTFCIGLTLHTHVGIGPCQNANAHRTRMRFITLFADIIDTNTRFTVAIVMAIAAGMIFAEFHAIATISNRIAFNTTASICVTNGIHPVFFCTFLIFFAFSAIIAIRADLTNGQCHFLTIRARHTSRTYMRTDIARGIPRTIQIAVAFHTGMRIRTFNRANQFFAIGVQILTFRIGIAFHADTMGHIADEPLCTMRIFCANDAHIGNLALCATVFRTVRTRMGIITFSAEVIDTHTRIAICARQTCNAAIAVEMTTWLI